MDGWNPVSSSSLAQNQRDDEKLAQQSKQPVNQVENEVALTIQGQRTVQDILDKATELFRRLQAVKLSADSTRQSQVQNREIRDNLSTLKGLFAKLRALHDETKRRVNTRLVQNGEDLIPFKNTDREVAIETDIDSSLVAEHQALQQKLRQKNEQIQELMDALRTMIWDINTMVALKPP